MVVTPKRLQRAATRLAYPGVADALDEERGNGELEGQSDLAVGELVVRRLRPPAHLLVHRRRGLVLDGQQVRDEEEGGQQHLLLFRLPGEVDASLLILGLGDFAALDVQRHDSALRGHSLLGGLRLCLFNS